MKYLDYIWGHAGRTGLIIGLSVFIFTAGIRQAGMMQFLELAAYDFFIPMQSRLTAIENRITLITINEDDIRELGQWPVPDETLARALTILLRHQPRAIGIDMYRDTPMPPGHEALTSVFSDNSNIIAVMKCGSSLSDGVRAPKILQGTDQVGFVDMIVDVDGVVRRGILYMDNGRETFSSFAMQLALIFLKSEGFFSEPDLTDPRILRLGKTPVVPFESTDGGYIGADAAGYQMLLDYRDDRDRVSHISLSKLLTGAIDPDKIKGRLILIGVTAESVKDYFYTPISKNRQTDHQMSGVELHALITGQLISLGMGERKPLHILTNWQEIVWIFFWSLAGGLIGARSESAKMLLTIAISGLLCIGFTAHISFVQSWWIPVVPPALAWALSAIIAPTFILGMVKRQRTQIMGLFAAHVSREFADAICSQANQFIDQGRAVPQQLDATILFLDIVGFTTVAESMPPEVLLPWLNRFMNDMADQVSRHQGVVCKFMGDAIMAAFGAPVPRKSMEAIRQDAIHAVDCALAMQYSLLQLNHQFKAEDLPVISIRIGIHTGSVTAGSMGSASRMEYTLIGDPVNIAARLESFQKNRFLLDPLVSPCRICIGESTWQLTQNEFATQNLGELLLKGKLQPIVVYRVMGRN
ncbi:MAG: CHASE2 domain-containing protein [Desulfatirhabdiaceae bacterium]